MDWFILALISVTTASISSLFQRVLMKGEKSDPFAYGLVFQFLSAVLVAFFAIWHGFVFLPLDKIGGNLVLEAMLYAGFTLFLFKALQTTEASQVTILGSTRVFWTILVALAFLGESLDIKKIAGVFLIISAIAFVFYRKKSIYLGKGGIFALLAAFCFGVAFANDTYILRFTEAFSYTVIAFTLPGIVILGLNPGLVKKMRILFKPSILTKMIIMSFFYSTAAVTAYLAYQKGGAATQLAPIFQFSVILTVILAVILLKERDNLIKKLIGAVIATIGIIFLR